MNLLAAKSRSTIKGYLNFVCREVVELSLSSFTTLLKGTTSLCKVLDIVLYHGWTAEQCLIFKFSF